MKHMRNSRKSFEMEFERNNKIMDNKTYKDLCKEDYKERLKIEYHQTKTNYDKLHNMLIKYEAGTLNFTPTCDIEILEKQAMHMGNYLKCLEIRAEIDKITLI